MPLYQLRRQVSNFFLAAALVAVLASSVFDNAYAAGALVATTNGITNGGTSVSASFTSVATANNLLIAVCGAHDAVTITGPTGFSTAKNETGTPSQGIFYKVATGGEQSLSCTASVSARLGIQIYEYSGMVTSSPLDAVNTTASTGTSVSPASGSVVTTSASDLILAAVTTNTGTGISSWTNSLTLENGFSNSGAKTSQSSYSGADRFVSATGTYSSVATAGASAAWRGQIVAFKQVPLILSADIVDASGVSVTNPSVSMSTATYSFACQTVTGVLGTSTQKVRISNTTTNPAWTVSIAATGGSTSKWSAGSPSYAFNNPTSSGCSAGQLAVNPAAGSITPQSGCTTTGVSLGSSSAFSAGITDAITLASASTSGTTGCYWDLTGIPLSQTIPAEQAVGAYTINLTVTLVAN